MLEHSPTLYSNCTRCHCKYWPH